MIGVRETFPRAPRSTANVSKRKPSELALRAVAVSLLAFLALPLLSLLCVGRPGDLVTGLRSPMVGPAVRLSLMSTMVSVGLIVVTGTPLAWLFARNWSHLRWVETMLQLPLVMPPAVAGIGLLLTFGRKGLLGGVLDRWDVGIPFTTTAVVLAQVFVSAPLYVQAATVAFRGLDETLVHVGRSLGGSSARIFFRIALPIAAPGLVAGAAVAWARALGEFGATLMFAGNLTGRTQTLPLVIYTAMEYDLQAARALSVVLVILAFIMLRLVPRRRAT